MKYLNPSFSVPMGSDPVRHCSKCPSTKIYARYNHELYCKECYENKDKVTGKEVREADTAQ